MNNNYFKNNLSYIDINKTTSSTSGAPKKLEDLKFAKNSVSYENKGGSSNSLLGEATLNFMIAKSIKNTKDVVTYFLINELDMEKNPNLAELIKNCSRCVEEIKVWSKQAEAIRKSNLAGNKVREIPKFNSTYSKDETLISKTIAQLIIDVENGADKASKVNKVDNNYLITSLDYLVYALATENAEGLQYTQQTFNPNNAPQLKDFKEDYYKDNNKELTLHRVNTGKRLIDLRHLNDAIIIDSEFKGNELPENFNVYGYYNSNKDFEFLSNENRNNCVLTFNNATPVLTIAYPKTLKDAKTGELVEVEYTSVIDSVKKNLEKKYNSLTVELTDAHIDNVTSNYAKKKGKVHVLINAQKPADELNESNVPKDIINMIFQSERAFNEVTVKDINKTLNLSEKQIVTKKGIKNSNNGFNAPKIKSSEININELKNAQIFRSCNIKNHSQLIQRAIALGSTMNSLKLNGYLSKEATKASCLFLQSQFNKTISLLSSNQSLCIMPYISKKIYQSFEREVKAQGLTKKEVISRFKQSGMSVIADETFTLQQIMNAKPDRTLEKEISNQTQNVKEEIKPLVKENEVEAEKTKEIEKASKDMSASLKKHYKLIKGLKKTKLYKSAKPKLTLLNLDEDKKEQKEAEDLTSTEPQKQVEQNPAEKASEPNTENQVENNKENEIKEAEKQAEAEKENKAVVVEVDYNKLKPNIKKKVQKAILNAREKVTTKIDSKLKILKDTKKSAEALKAYNFTAVFAELLGAKFNNKPRTDVEIYKINQELLLENIESIKKQATVLANDYNQLVDVIVEEIIEELKNSTNTTIGYTVNKILISYKPAIENLIINETTKLYSVKLTKKQESAMELKLGEKLVAIRSRKENKEENELEGE